MDAIWRAAGGKLDEIEAGVDAAANDTFISMMDAAALSDMEAFLDIAPNKNRTLEVRRKLVASYFVGANHIGAPEIKELVRGYTGDTPEVKFSKGRIYVCISPPDESAFFSSDIIECLLRKIPAHLALSLSLSYKPDVQPAYAAAGRAAICTALRPTGGRKTGASTPSLLALSRPRRALVRSASTGTTRPPSSTPTRAEARLHGCASSPVCTPARPTTSSCFRPSSRAARAQRTARQRSCCSGSSASLTTAVSDRLPQKP